MNALVTIITPSTKNSMDMSSNKTSKNKSLVKNSLWFLINNVLNILFPFATGIYVARVLLPEYIGNVSAAQNLAQYFVILAFLGIPSYGMREIAKTKHNKDVINKTYSELFCINFLSTIIFSFVYLAIISSVPIYRNHYFLYLIAGLSIAFNSINNTWLFDGLEEFKFTSLRNVIFKAITFVALILFVKRPDDYYLYAIITVLGASGNYLINIFYSRKFVNFTFKGISLKKHLKPIIYLVVVNLAIEVYTLVDITMLNIFKSSENVAYYKYGSNICKLLLQIINTFTMVIVPRASFLYKENKKNDFNRLISKVFILIVFLSLPMIIGILFTSNYLVCAIYGQAYYSSSIVLMILCPVLFISPIGYLLGSRVLLISGNEKKMIAPVCIGAIVNVIGNYFLIQAFSEYGAAISSVISEVVVMIIYIFLGKKIVHLSFKIIEISKIVGSLFSMATILLLLHFFVDSQPLKCVLEISLSVFVYFLLNYIFKEELLMSLFHKRKKETKSGEWVDLNL